MVSCAEHFRQPVAQTRLSVNPAWVMEKERKNFEIFAGLNSLLIVHVSNTIATANKILFKINELWLPASM